MIGKLRGLVDEVDGSSVVIDVNGVGYQVNCASRTLESLPPKGEEVALMIETHVREDDIRLFGFSTASEREAFRVLQGVQGVGNRVALAILGVMPPNEIASAISFQEKAAFTKVPGVGPKLAERLIVELRNKAAQFGAAASTPAALADPRATDAVSALANLGYPRDRATTAVTRVLAEDRDAKVETVIRRTLQTLTGPV